MVTRNHPLTKHSPAPHTVRGYACAMNAKAKYNDYEYLKRTAALRRAVETHGLHCHLCDKPIDLTLPSTHPMSFTADHLDAIANGGSLYGSLAPAHRRCNSRRQNRRLPAQIKKPKTTRAW